MARKEILDIGAGKWPSNTATRAIDKKKPHSSSIHKPPSLIEYKQANVENIPYPDNYFKKVVSRWALGCRIFTQKAYNEIARVLQPGGKIEVRLLWKDRRYKRKLINRLNEAGIVVYIEYKGVYVSKRRLTEFIICGKKG